MDWLRGLMAVLSAFAGIRQRRAAERDQRIKPWLLALALVVAVIGLLTMLLCLALWASSSPSPLPSSARSPLARIMLDNASLIRSIC